MIDARFRPLDPSAWPQALTTARRSPQFRSPLSATLDLLETELEAIKAKDIVIETAHAQRDIRNDGWPRADARVPSFPGVILSFDSTHGPLRYLTDTFEAGKETDPTENPPRCSGRTIIHRRWKRWTGSKSSSSR